MRLPIAKSSVAWSASVIAIPLIVIALATPSYACSVNDGRYCGTVAKPKKAKRAVRATDANGNWLVPVRSDSGKTAKVASRYARQFQGFIDDLEAHGYRIDFMGGWRRSGTCRSCDAHPAGRAIDINQTARNRVTRKLPANVTSIAARHGICHGAIWDRPDGGHFEIAEKSRATSCRRFARKHWPRLVQRIETP